MTDATQMDPETPLDQRRTQQVLDLHNKIVKLVEGQSSVVIINALVNALAEVYADGMLHARFRKVRVMEQLSITIDMHYRGHSDAN